MNPRTDFEECDPATARAFVTMFREKGDVFNFGIDQRSDVTQDEVTSELRARLSEEDFEHDGQTTFGVTAINDSEGFSALKSFLEGMEGVEILESDSEVKEDEQIGEYTAEWMTVTATGGAEWDVPHLVVYGSLRPELEEAVYDAFGTGINAENVRNHYLVYGDHLEEGCRGKLVSAIQRSNNFFDDEQRDFVSDVRTADFV